MIKGHRIRITTRPGKIKSGMIRPGTKFPMSLPYLNVSAHKELLDAYGSEPEKLLIYFPSNTVADFFDDRYGHYAGGKDNPVLTRSCDTEKVIHRIAETCNGVKFGAGEESDCVCNDMSETIPDGKGGQKANPERCRYNCQLKAYIGIPPTWKVDSSSCYLFETGSRNSGEHLISEIEKILSLNMGSIMGIPFIISVKMISGRNDAKQKFPIWNLRMPLLLSELRADRMLSEGFEPGRILLEESTSTEANIESGKPVVPTVTELLMELEEIKSAPTVEKVDEWVARRKDQIEGMTNDEKKKIRKLYDEINEKITPPAPVV